MRLISSVSPYYGLMRLTADYASCCVLPLRIATYCFLLRLIASYCILLRLIASIAADLAEGDVRLCRHVARRPPALGKRRRARRRHRLHPRQRRPVRHQPAAQAIKPQGLEAPQTRGRLVPAASVRRQPAACPSRRARARGCASLRVRARACACAFPARARLRVSVRVCRSQRVRVCLPV